MKYAIQVHRCKSPAPRVSHACQFIKAALAEGHEVIRVFFYQDGVRHGFRAAENDSAEWESLNGQVDLVLCISAAERRGLEPSDLRPGFRIGGLGLWMDACVGADRVLVFEN